MSVEGPKTQNLSGLEYAVAGAGTGFITRFSCQPLDVLKIRFQLQVEPIKRSSTLSKYTSLWQATKLIVKEEGIGSLWKGHVPAQYLSIMFGSVQFICYEKLTNYANNFRPYKYSWEDTAFHFGCGSAAGLIAVVSSYPLDIIRTRLVAQGEPKVYSGMYHACKQIWKNEGLRGYSKGLVPACMQMAPLAGLTFGFHHIFKTFWMTIVQDVDPNGVQPISTAGSLFSGSLAGLFSKILVYPLDVIKKRLQVQGFDKKVSCSKNVLPGSGVIQCLILITRVEGFFGLFKGLAPALLKAGTSSAIYFTAYDKVCQFLLYTKR